MLHDPKQGIRAQYQHLRDWLAQKNPHDWYDWSDRKNCLLCQYYGSEWTEVWEVMRQDFGQDHRLVSIAVGSGPDRMDGWTYGGALERCDMVIAELDGGTVPPASVVLQQIRDLPHYTYLRLDNPVA